MRDLFAISIKHTENKWKYGMPCVLWGSRTEGDKRSFSGYTVFPDNAEIYEAGDFAAYGYSDYIVKPEPVHMEIRLCKTYRKYDTVLIPVDEYLRYCEAAGLPTGQKKQ